MGPGVSWAAVYAEIASKDEFANRATRETSQPAFQRLPLDTPEPCVVLTCVAQSLSTAFKQEETSSYGKAMELLKNAKKCWKDFVCICLIRFIHLLGHLTGRAHMCRFHTGALRQ